MRAVQCITWHKFCLLHNGSTLSTWFGFRHRRKHIFLALIIFICFLFFFYAVFLRICVVCLLIGRVLYYISASREISCLPVGPPISFDSFLARRSERMTKKEHTHTQQLESEIREKERKK